jgi:hypothetical protein
MTLDVAIINASVFEPYIGDSFRMQDCADLDIPVTLKQCRENPKGEMPGAPRTPFSLEFEAESENVPPFQWRNLSFLHSEIPAFGPVYVTRIINPTSPTRALFQVIFG